MLTVNEAAFLLYEGVADAESVDEVFRSCFGHPMGPLETADLIGVDTILYSVEVLYEHYSDSKYRPCPLLRQMTDAGLHGRKSGRGFYDYTVSRTLTPRRAPMSDHVQEHMLGFVRGRYPDAQISGSDDIFALGFVNSLFAMELVMFIEKEFAVTIPNGELQIDNFRTPSPCPSWWPGARRSPPARGRDLVFVLTAAATQAGVVHDRASARAFVDAHIAPHANGFERAGLIPRSCWPHGHRGLVGAVPAA